MTGSGGIDGLRLARLASQGLAGARAGTPEEVVRRLLAAQAQDERAFRLAVRSRTDGLTAADVDASLSQTRSLVVTWLNRGTLHLVASEDYWWLHPLTAPRVAGGNERRLRQLGVDRRQSERGIDTIAGAVVADGPQTRDALRRRLDRARVPTGGQALVHLLAAASLRGHVVRGPVVDGAHAYVSVEEWLGAAPSPLDSGDALGRLARRYLTGHAPATARDLANWAGITLGDARRGLAAIADEVVEVADVAEVAGATGKGGPDPGYRLASDGAVTGRFPDPRLLGAFDPLLHGWRSRAPFVGDHAGVVTMNGIFRPVALVDGRVVATWGLPGGIVTISPLERLSRPVRAALEEDGADVQRFLQVGGRSVVFT